MKKALKRHGQAKVIVTDKLRSYPAAMRELGNLDRREMGRWKNNRAENSHLPFRRRERAMLRFRQMKTLQKFASIHANIPNHFSSERHLVDRQNFKERRAAALTQWLARNLPNSKTCFRQTETSARRTDNTATGNLTRQRRSSCSYAVPSASSA